MVIYFRMKEQYKHTTVNKVPTKKTLLHLYNLLLQQTNMIYMSRRSNVGLN